MLRKYVFGVALCCSTLLFGCATRMQPGIAVNPPPHYPLRTATAFELKPLEATPEIKDREPKVFAKLQTQIDAKVNPLLKSWKRGSGNKKLIVTPSIEKLKFISGGERFFAGALAGSSAIQMRWLIQEAGTGTVVANPLFYQHANAFGGAHTFGTTDNLMLDRIVDMMVAYLRDNYDHAVGGATGDDSAS